MIDNASEKVKKPLETLKGTINQWEGISELLPPDIAENELGWLQSYFQAQLHIKNKELLKANAVFTEELLPHGEDYINFEERNAPLLGAIDVLVRGETSMSNKPALSYEKPEKQF